MLTLSVSRGCEAVDGGALAWACRRPQGPRGTGSRMFDRWRSEPWTLQSHLMLYGAILSLPTLIFCGVLLFRSAVIERRQIERDTVDVVRSLAADIDSDLIATTTILRALATSPALSRGDIPMFERQMRAAVEPGVFELLLANQNGQQLINTRLAIGDALPKLNSVNWQTALSDKKPIVSDLFLGATARRFILNISMPVYQEGRPAYVLIAAFAPERVLDILQRQALTREWSLGVSDRQGRIIARSNQHERFVGQILRDDLRRGSDQHREAVVWATTNLLGEPVLRTTVRSKVSGWLIAATVPIGVANAPLYQSWRFLGALGACSLLASAILAHLFGRKAAEPIVALAESVRTLGQGKTIEPMQSRVQEVNAVAGAMAAASQELRQRTEALAESRARIREHRQLGNGCDHQRR